MTEHKLKHEVKHKTTVRFIPGMGDIGEAVYIMEFKGATGEYGDYRTAHRCPVCGYGRCEVTIDHNPELGDDVEIRCNACGCELNSAIKTVQDRSKNDGMDR